MPAYYIYDASLAGLFCVFAKAKELGRPPDAICAGMPAELPMFTETIVVPTAAEQAAQVAYSLEKLMGQHNLDTFGYVNRSAHPLAPFWLYQYAQLGKELGWQTNRALTKPVVQQVMRLRRQVTGERHRLLGLVRFRSTAQGVYYAQISPDNDVVELLGSHFAARMRDQLWTIHDTVRQTAVVGCNGDFQYLRWPQHWQPEICDTFAEELWQQYFVSVSNSGRDNPRQQASCMPRRYWKHLIEQPGAARLQANKDPWK